MSNHPHFEIFWTSSKIWRIRIFFQNSKFHVRKNCCWCHQWAIYQKNFWRRKNSKIPKFSRQKWVECEMKIFFKTLSAHRFLKVDLVPQFRKLLNVWHIQNLEQPFLIWACNCLVKFWRSPKNFKIQKFLWKIRNHLSKKNSPQKILDFEIFWTSSKFDEAIAGPNQKRLLQILDMSYI